VNKIIHIGDKCYEIVGTIKENVMTQEEIQSKKETWTFDSIIYDKNNRIFALCNNVLDAEIVESIQ